MKNYSKNISIYLAQFFSIASILGRISINGLILITPVFLTFYRANFFNGLFFFIKWFSIIIFVYHILHFWKEIIVTVKGFLGGLMLLLLIVLLSYGTIFQDFGFILLALYLIVYHTAFGLFSFFVDYSITDNNKMRFWSTNLFIILISMLFVFFIIFSLL